MIGAIRATLHAPTLPRFYASTHCPSDERPATRDGIRCFAGRFALGGRGDFVPNTQRSGDKMPGTSRFFLLSAGQGVAAARGAKRGEIFVPNVQHHPFVEADVFPPTPAGSRDVLKRQQRGVLSFKF